MPARRSRRWHGAVSVVALVAAVACGAGSGSGRSAGCGTPSAAVPTPRAGGLPRGARVLSRRAAWAPVGAYGGTVAWSEFDPEHSDYRLMVRAGGRTRQVAVAARCIPFDVSVGPGPGGTPVLAYTRCAVESGDADRQFGAFFAPDPQSPMSGCRIYLVSAAGGGPERVVAGIGGRGVGVRDPVIWGGQIAWIEGRLSLSPTQRVMTRSLVSAGRPAVVSLEPRQSCYEESDATGEHRHCVAVTGSGYEQIALRAGALAASVYSDAVGCGFATAFITLARPGAKLQTVDGLCSGMAGQDFGGLSFDGRWLYFNRLCREDSDGCRGSDVFRVPVGAARGQRAIDGLGTQVRGFAFSGGMEYALADDSRCYTAGDCALVALSRLHFH